MKSSTPQQATWRTSDRSPWWLRSSSYGEPNGDYKANCYLNLWRTPHNSENNIQFNDGNCGYHSRSYYCQTVQKPKPKPTPAPAPPPPPPPQGLWKVEKKNKYCPSHKMWTNSKGQQDCQNRCVNRKGCVGMSISYKSISTRYCYVCNNDKLANAANNFHFYRREALWKKVKDNTYCSKNKHWSNSKGPRDCQSRCNKMGNTCKGISISYKSISTQWCYACKDEKSFSRAANQFHYYRKEGKWGVSNKNKYCPANKFWTNSQGPRDCQKRCNSMKGCVGISHSYKSISTRYCYACKNDKLANAANNFHFYRSPLKEGLKLKGQQGKWKKFANHKYCPASTVYTNSQGPRDCEKRCENTNGCKGISYSFKSISTRYCYVCKSDALANAANDFHLYRRSR